jgi:hypothetical protein
MLGFWEGEYMANFVHLSSVKNAPGYVNVDLVRRASEGLDGVLTLHFGPSDEMRLEGEDATAVIQEIKKHWTDPARAA